MTTKTWIGATGGDWFGSANWDPPGAPQTGDTVIIGSGGPTISGAAVIDEAITLGGSQSASSASLTAINTQFLPSNTSATSAMTLTVAGGDPSGAVLNAGFVASGGVAFNGVINVQARGGSLTIDSEPVSGGSAFDLVSGGTIAVNNESDLKLTGSAFTDNGSIIINTDTQVTIGNADLAKPFTFSGNGSLIVADGGILEITAGSNVSGGDSTAIDLSAGNDLLQISSQASLNRLILPGNKPDTNIQLLNFVESSWIRSPSRDTTAQMQH